LFPSTLPIPAFTGSWAYNLRDLHHGCDMELKTESQFREPVERALLERLLEADFSGRSELAALLRNVLVRTIDEDGGLELKSQIEGKAL